MKTTTKRLLPMTRCLGLFFALVFLMSSCGSRAAEDKPFLVDPAFDTDEYLPDVDADTGFLYLGSYMCETDDAYYFAEIDLNDPGFTKYIWYYDKKSGLSGKLCSRPECLHNDSTCNAYLNFNVGCLSVYKGRLYCFYDNFTTTLSEYDCISIKLDGTERKTEMAAPFEPYGSTNRICFIHRGYIYEIMNTDSVEAGQQLERVTLSCWNLETGESELLFEKSGGKYMCQIRAVPVGNDIYFVTDTYPEGKLILGLYKLDTGTREIETYYDGPSEYDSMGLWPVEGDGIYLNSNNIAENKCCTGKYDFKTGEFTYRDTGTIIGKSNIFNGKLICYSPDGVESGAVIYSLDGEKLAETAMITEIDGEKIYGTRKDGYIEPWLQGFNDEYAFIKYEKSSNDKFGNTTEKSLIYYAFPLDGSEPIELWRTEKVYETAQR